MHAALQCYVVWTVPPTPHVSNGEPVIGIYRYSIIIILNKFCAAQSAIL